MGITPIELASLASHRSDIGKVAGDDYLRLQQQHIASLTAKDEEEQRNKTQQVDNKEGLEVQTDVENRHPQQQHSEHEENNKDEISSELEGDNVEFVAYKDPDVGNTLDWQG